MTVGEYVKGKVTGMHWVFEESALDSICFQRGTSPDYELDFSENSDMKTARIVEADYYVIISLNASYTPAMLSDGGGFKKQERGYDTNEWTKKRALELANIIYKEYGEAVVGNRWSIKTNAFGHGGL